MAGFLEHYPAPAKSDVGGESNLWVNITVTLTSSSSSSCWRSPSQSSA